MSTDVEVAVVGAGIAGLVAASALARAGRRVQVFEAAGQVGGRMRTVRWNGFTIDTGAEVIGTHGYPATWRLIRRLGLSGQDVPVVRAGVAMWRDGRARYGVGEPSALLTGAGLSVRGRLALAAFTAGMLRIRGAIDPDALERTPLGTATVAELADRYGTELGEYLLQPLVAGMFGWHPQASAAAPFVATMLGTRGTRTWRTFRDGMDTPARMLAERVPVRLGEPVRQVVSLPGAARLSTGRGTVLAGQVLLCVPAPVALELHVNAPADEHAFLAACGYGPAVRVAYPLARPLYPPTRRGAHILAVPAVQDPDVSGYTFDHVRHPERAPAGRGLVTVLASPARAAELLDASEDEVAEHLTRGAERHLPGLRAAALATLVHRFRHGLPSVPPAALRLRAGFLARPARPVEYAGDWTMLRPSSEGAVRSGELAAARVLARLPGQVRVAP